jgi:hypothetical protein
MALSFSVTSDRMHAQVMLRWFDRPCRAGGGIDRAHARRQRNEDRYGPDVKRLHWNPMAIDRYDLVINTGHSISTCRRHRAAYRARPRG